MPRALAAGLLPLAVACSVACRTPGASAGSTYLFVHGGRIYPSAEAEPVDALWIRDGRVVAVGSRAELEPVVAEVERSAAAGTVARLDLAGATAVPGLVDAHGHLEGLGDKLETVDLGGCRSLDELVERVAARAAKMPPGEWILGRGWDQTLFPGQEFPHHALLSARVPEHPVFLARVDGHAAFVNARALALAGIEGERALEGGRIVVGAEGKPTGVLVDVATALVSAHIPRPDRSTRKRRLLAAQEALLACGLVGVHDMGTSPETLAVLQELEREGELKLRVASYLWANEGLPADAPGAAWSNVVCASCAELDHAHKLRIVGAKLMIDGAVGSRGAALLAPYADAPGESGLPRMSAEVLAQRLAVVIEHGLQPATHAIGDRGNRMVLDAYERALPAELAARFRPRIEHAQVVAIEDWPRFDALGVIPSMQPTHATSDMRWAEARLGPERVRGAYAWRRLSSARAPLALGSDFPVESPRPLLGIYAARTRTDAEGNPPGGWLADQCLTGREALAGFTSGAAYAAHEETRRGRLEPGFAADLTVLSVDPVTCPVGALLDARVVATIVDGERVYPSPSAAD